MAEEEDYEGLPESSPLAAHMLSGAMAGVAEHCVMYPVDSIKTRMMALSPDPKAVYRNPLEAFTRIITTEGLFRPLRGVTAMLGGAGPAHAMYFACYEKMKVKLSETSLGPGAVSQGVAGACATVCHDVIMNPADVIKQRMQVYGSSHTACIACGRAVLQREGASAFYRSFSTQLTMNIPFQALHFVIYEKCQDMLNSERAWNPWSHVVSGGAAGGVAAALTTPLDVCKTLLNTQESCVLKRSDKSTVSGLLEAWRTVYRVRGVRGFYAGVQARVLYQVPSTGISWTVYELFKHYLSSGGNDSGDDGSPELEAELAKLETTHNTTEVVAEKLNRQVAAVSGVSPLILHARIQNDSLAEHLTLSDRYPAP